ncbi:MAG: 16S rRNA (cytosine(1402)-N(4))-methyltransferase RsmH [Lachnoclostridium sp.]|nr:16S rRNA (cytosine(1402)-N(4))-methyltransferase RsmH [Lachnoclostridium sp.]
MSQLPYHIPALLPEALQALDIKPDGVYIDVTYGGGGHSRAIVEHLDAAVGGHLYGFDQDEEAVANAMDDPRFTIVHSNFRYITNFMRYHEVTAVDGILADLGVSFHHFDTPDRGFSFRADGPLDMRMNRRATTTASAFLNNATEERIADVLYLYGELAKSRRIARAIVEARNQAPVDTVGRLLEIVKPYIDPRREKKEMAMLFQALRIEVNDEMGALRQLLEGACSLLREGGRLAIITYHSLEDRMVKNFMKTGNVEGRLEKDFFGRNQAPMKLLTSRPIIPSEQEVEANPRSRSAKLRIAVKL